MNYYDERLRDFTPLMPAEGIEEREEENCQPLLRCRPMFTSDDRVSYNLNDARISLVGGLVCYNTKCIFHNNVSVIHGDWCELSRAHGVDPMDYLWNNMTVLARADDREQI